MARLVRAAVSCLAVVMLLVLMPDNNDTKEQELTVGVVVVEQEEKHAQGSDDAETESEVKWTTQKVDSGVVKLRLVRQRGIFTFSDFVALLETKRGREIFSNALKSVSEFSGFFWELPPLSSRTLDLPFECVLVGTTEFEGLTPERDVFSEHFATPGKRVHSFPNMGGDAILVVPAPANPSSDFGHLAQFLRTADADQVDELWEAVAEVLRERVAENSAMERVWLSTAGRGVTWLHVRFDSEPKYYRHRPYKSPAWQPPSDS